MKVFGEGEWKVRQHGVSKRRTWRKLHLCEDAATLEIVAVCASTNDVSDGAMLLHWLDGLPAQEVAQVSADGAYDQRPCYDASIEWRRKPPSRRAGARNSGSVPTIAASATCAMKTCGRFAKRGGKICTPHFIAAVRDGLLPQAVTKHIIQAVSSALTEIGYARFADLERLNKALSEDQAIANLTTQDYQRIHEENNQLKAQLAAIKAENDLLKANLDQSANLWAKLSTLKDLTIQVHATLTRNRRDD